MTPVPAFPTIQPGMDFREASEAVVEYLKVALPLGFWAVTRYDGTDQLYLEVRDESYGLGPGGSHRWSDSFCQHMVAGRTPQIAADAMSIPEYASAGVASQITIGAYVGIPIEQSDGSLFGTICGLDPEAQSPDIAQHAPLLALLSGLLSSILEADRARVLVQREAEQAMEDAETDELTGLRNRRGWTARIELEEARYARFGDPAAVLVIDLDRLKAINDEQGHEAGDRYIVAAAEAIASSISRHDTVARLGGDEFGVLLAGVDAATARKIADRIMVSFESAGVAGSIGLAPYTVVAGFPGAMAQADAEMYAEKARRRAAEV